MSKRLKRLQERLEEVRRYGWLRDYHHELDQGPDRSASTARPAPAPPAASSTPPINVTVNINLGDILKQIASGDKSAKEALEEMMEDRRQREPLNEDR